MLLQSQALHPLGPQTETEEHLPTILIDHGKDCRCIVGGIFVCWFICPKSWVKFSFEPTNAPSEDRIETSANWEMSMGEMDETTYMGVFESSENIYRNFCSNCGTHLTYDWDRGAENDTRPKLLSIVLGTLDTESLSIEGVRPTREEWIKDGVGWVRKLVAEGSKNFSG
jgi:hypothetical protein